MLPKISIVTPSFNQGRYLEENILSVIHQDYPNVEHIIIDGGSTDETKDVIEKYRSHLAYVVSEPDKGQSDAVNKGFAKTTGEIVGWLNSDDYYAPGTLHTVAKAFANPETKVVTGYSILFDETGKQRRAFPTITKERDIAFHIRFPDINQPATFFRKKTMAEFMPLNIDLHYIMDREMWAKYILQYGLKGTTTLEDVLVYFRYHAESKSQSKDIEFDNEYATMLHSFASHSNMQEVADLLASRFKINPAYKYSNGKYPDRDTTLNMIRFFTLKRGGLVFTRLQFDFAKKAYKLLNIKDYKTLTMEEYGLKRIEYITHCINWLHYRIKRKLNYMFSFDDAR